MVLYAPPASINYKENNRKTKVLPIFNKSVYTRELIEFIIDLVETEQKTPAEIIKDYRIPKTTLYKWLRKHKK